MDDTPERAHARRRLRRLLDKLEHAPAEGPPLRAAQKRLLRQFRPGAAREAMLRVVCAEFGRMVRRLSDEDLAAVWEEMRPRDLKELLEDLA